MKTCFVSQQDKPEKRLEVGLLQPIDFISGFPKVDDMSFVMMIIDLFTKYAVIVPTPATCSVDKAAELFLRYVINQFSVPEDIVSNRDARFTWWF